MQAGRVKWTTPPVISQGEYGRRRAAVQPNRARRVHGSTQDLANPARAAPTRAEENDGSAARISAARGYVKAWRGRDPN